MPIDTMSDFGNLLRVQALRNIKKLNPPIYSRNYELGYGWLRLYVTKLGNKTEVTVSRDFGGRSFEVERYIFHTKEQHKIRQMMQQLKHKYNLKKVFYL